MVEGGLHRGEGPGHPATRREALLRDDHAPPGLPLATIAAWLDHQDPAFTLRTYVRVPKEELTTAAAVMNRVVTPP